MSPSHCLLSSSFPHFPFSPLFSSPLFCPPPVIIAVELVSFGPAVPLNTFATRTNAPQRTHTVTVPVLPSVPEDSEERSFEDSLLSLWLFHQLALASGHSDRESVHVMLDLYHALYHEVRERKKRGDRRVGGRRGRGRGSSGVPIHVHFVWGILQQQHLLQCL